MATCTGPYHLGRHIDATRHKGTCQQRAGEPPAGTISLDRYRYFLVRLSTAPSSFSVIICRGSPDLPIGRQEGLGLIQGGTLGFTGMVEDLGYH